MTVYMPMVPDLAMMMLTCARIGAVHLVVFAGFSADTIADRVADAAASGRRGGRSFPLMPIVDVAIGKEICKGIVRKELVFDGQGEGVVHGRGSRGCTSGSPCWRRGKKNGRDDISTPLAWQ